MNKTNDLLIQRGKLLQEFAEKMPLRTDQLCIVLDEPDNGWIDTRLYVNDTLTESLNISNACSPFEDIKEWLEHIVRHIFVLTPIIRKPFLFLFF